jgi:hypothetical protein
MLQYVVIFLCISVSLMCIYGKSEVKFSFIFEKLKKMGKIASFLKDLYFSFNVISNNSVLCKNISAVKSFDFKIKCDILVFAKYIIALKSENSTISTQIIDLCKSNKKIEKIGFKF